MVKKILLFMLITSCALYLSSVIFAADKDDDEMPPWMEDVKVRGRSTYLVPKGAKRTVIGSQVVVEPPNEYVARRLYEIEQAFGERLKKIEDTQKTLINDVQELQKVLKAIQDKINVQSIE